MRGEHPLPWTPTLAGGGSSPHARGAHTGPEQGTSPRRIIPACAGSTRSWGNIGSPQRDHPRMRGEHDGIYAAYRGDEGSSPHARGAPVRHVGQDLVAGIIPACAGSTIRCGSGRTWRQDHPRMRGEHFASNATSAASQGSSPHARGALMSSLSVASTPWDHPRMRGEHEIEVGSIVASPGSSPHARGALVEELVVAGGDGIIPACAGSTLEYLRLCPGLKRITLTLPITSEADKRTEKHPNHQLMPRAFRPSRRHCRAGCGPIHCLTLRTSWPSCTCLPCSSPFSSCRQASRHPCPSAS